MIKNIIFDLGGIILNIDFNRASIAFNKLGINDFSSLYSQAIQSNLFINLELGILNEDDFCEEIRLLCGLNLTNNEIISAWNELILDFPPARLQLIHELKYNYRCFLLSNTNKIHYDYYQSNLRHNHNINGLESLFEKAYFSHEINLRKPNIDSYEFVLKENKLNAEETLFIDDSIQNIEAAKQININTLFINLETKDDILNHFRNNKYISNEQ